MTTPHDPRARHAPPRLRGAQDRGRRRGGRGVPDREYPALACCGAGAAVQVARGEGRIGDGCCGWVLGEHAGPVEDGSSGRSRRLLC